MPLKAILGFHPGSGRPPANQTLGFEGNCHGTQTAPQQRIFKIDQKLITRINLKSYTVSEHYLGSKIWRNGWQILSETPAASAALAAVFLGCCPHASRIVTRQAMINHPILGGFPWSSRYGSEDPGTFLFPEQPLAMDVHPKKIWQIIAALLIHPDITWSWLSRSF